MTSIEEAKRDERTINRIRAVLQVHDQLQAHAAELDVSIEDTRIVVRGELPSNNLKSALLPAVRQAGVLSQVANCVSVAGS